MKKLNKIEQKKILETLKKIDNDMFMTEGENMSFRQGMEAVLKILNYDSPGVWAFHVYQEEP